MTSFSALHLPGPTAHVVFKFNVTDPPLLSSLCQAALWRRECLSGAEMVLGKVLGDLGDLGPSLTCQLSLAARVGLEQSQVV